MPTFTSSRKANVLTSNQIISGVSYPTYSDVTTFSSTRVVPSTTKRKKPLDLFANSTARRLSTKKGVVLQPEATRVKYNQNNIFYSWNYSIPSMDTLSRNLGLRPEIDGNMLSINNILLNKIKDQKCNLSVSVAELGKATDMVFNMARDIWKVFHSIRSGRALPDFVRLINDKSTPVSRRFASRFLEYTYGWTPTAMDVYGLSQLIEQRIQEGVHIYVDATRTEKKNFTSLDYAGTPTSSDLLVLKGRARYKVDNRYLRTLSQSGITNPGLLAWELIPYSFVIDWVIDIGGYLSTLDALNGVSDLIVIKSGLFERCETQLTPKSIYTLSQGEAFLVERITNRLTPSSALPSILPRYEPSISVRRMLNATALLRNLIK